MASRRDSPLSFETSAKPVRPNAGALGAKWMLAQGRGCLRRRSDFNRLQSHSPTGPSPPPLTCRLTSTRTGPRPPHLPSNKPTARALRCAAMLVHMGSDATGSRVLRQRSSNEIRVRTYYIHIASHRQNNFFTLVETRLVSSTK